MFRLLWDKLRTTIWFIPSLLSLAGMAGAVLLVQLDLRLDSTGWAWLEVFRIGTTGVRQVLSVTAGAIMTITGVVFSISVVTLTLAANQFGARLLRNYLSDSHNKIVLGLFVGTFLFALVVLTSIDSHGSEQIPTLAFITSLILTIVSVAALIFFIHNISTSIQADRLIARIGLNLSDTIAGSLPADEGDSQGNAQLHEHWRIATRDRQSIEVNAARSGYVQFVDYDALLQLAGRSQSVIELQARPGDFVIAGSPLATLYTDAPGDDGIRETSGDIRRHLSLGSQRTTVQDLEYSITQLLQIAQRALSPGINDSLTAIACIDWLGAALAGMADRRFPARYRSDAKGTLRLKVRTFDYIGAVDAILSPLRQNARANEMVLIRLLEVIAAVMRVCAGRAALESLQRHAGMIRSAARKNFPEPQDIAASDGRYADCEAIFEQRVKGLQ